MLPSGTAEELSVPGRPPCHQQPWVKGSFESRADFFGFTPPRFWSHQSLTSLQFFNALKKKRFFFSV